MKTAARTESATTEAPSLTERAEQAVQSLELLALGKDYRPIATQARAAVTALQADARDRIFPERFAPVEDGPLRDFDLATRNFPPINSLTATLIAMHADSIDSHPRLAEIVRGVRGQRIIVARIRQNAGAGVGQTLVEAQAAAEARARGRFMKEICEQLQARNLFDGYPEIITSTVPALNARIESAIANHEGYERVEAERVKAERIEAERVAAEQERSRVEAVWGQNLQRETLEQRLRRETIAAFYLRHGRYDFRVAGVDMTGEEAARRIVAGADISPFIAGQTSGTAPLRYSVSQ